MGAGKVVGASGVMMFSMLVFDPRGLHDETRMEATTNKVKKHRDDPCALCFDVDLVALLIRVLLFIFFTDNVRFCRTENIGGNDLVAFYQSSKIRFISGYDRPVA